MSIGPYPQPLAAPRVCPGCAPDRDLTREIVDIAYCVAHAPDQRGADDAAVRDLRYLSSPSEAEGHDCRAWAEVIHRRRPC